MALRPPLSNLYEELGVSRDASHDEIAAAYRARAKELHPDARPDDATAAERFTRLGAAYRVLSNPTERAYYDASLSHAPAPAAAPVPASPAVRPVEPAPPRRLSRRGARWCVWGGTTLVVLGLLMGAFVVSLERRDAELRAKGVAVVAVVVEVDGERRLEFQTADGDTVQAVESIKTGEEQPAVGSRLRVHYDREHPTRIVTDESHTGRDVTLWIVAVKLVIGGAVLVGFGAHRLRRAS